MVLIVRVGCVLIGCGCESMMKRRLRFVVKLNSCLSLWNSLLCSIVSYAFDRSMYIARVACCLLACLWMLFVIVWRASVVLDFGLKAYCVVDRMLWLRRGCISWVLMSVSKIFAMMGSRDMGRKFFGFVVV